jgi:hypothetical protein
VWLAPFENVFPVGFSAVKKSGYGKREEENQTSYLDNPLSLAKITETKPVKR